MMVGVLGLQKDLVMDSSVKCTELNMMPQLHLGHSAQVHHYDYKKVRNDIVTMSFIISSCLL